MLTLCYSLLISMTHWTSPAMSYLPSLLACCFLLLAAILLIVVGILNASTAMQLRFDILRKRLRSTRSTRETTSDKERGRADWSPIWFVLLVFAVGVVAGHLWPRDQYRVFYGLHVERVLSQDSLNLVSKETGPFRADFCPENKIAKYEPEAGYVVCRLKYVDRGCIDISGNGALTWVKNKYGWTAVMSDSDTFTPYPDCKKQEFIAGIGGAGR